MIDRRALLGTWEIVATTLPFWRGKRRPRVAYAERADGRWSDVLTWLDARGRERTLAGIDRVDGARIAWRGTGWLGWIASEWDVVALADDRSWCATHFSRASLGITPEGMDVYARDRARVDLEQVLEALRTRSDLPRLEGWYPTEA